METQNVPAVVTASPVQPKTDTFRNRAAAFALTAVAAAPAFAIDASDITGAISGASALVAAGFGAMVVVVGSIWAGRKVLGLLGR